MIIISQKSITNIIVKYKWKYDDLGALFFLFKKANEKLFKCDIL